MQITVEPTGRFYDANEARVRAWTGTDALGLPVVALIIAVSSPTAVAELIAMPPPAPDWSESVARSMGELWRMAGQMTDMDMLILTRCADTLVRGNR